MMNYNKAIEITLNFFGFLEKQTYHRLSDTHDQVSEMGTTWFA